MGSVNKFSYLIKLYFGQLNSQDSHEELNRASVMALDNESDTGTISLREASSAASSTMQVITVV